MGTRMRYGGGVEAGRLSEGGGDMIVEGTWSGVVVLIDRPG